MAQSNGSSTLKAILDNLSKEILSNWIGTPISEHAIKNISKQVEDSIEKTFGKGFNSKVEYDPITAQVHVSVVPPINYVEMNFIIDDKDLENNKQIDIKEAPLIYKNRF